MTLPAASDALPLIAVSALVLLCLGGALAALIRRRQGESEGPLFVPQVPARAGHSQRSASSPKGPARDVMVAAPAPQPATAAAPGAASFAAPASAPGSPAAAAPVVAVPARIAPPALPVGTRRERLVVDREYAFSRLDGLLAGLGLTRTMETAADVAPGEPERASWSNARNRVSYAYDRVQRLRLVEIEGERSNLLAADLLNLACVPAIDRAAVLEMLRSEVATDVLVGIAAAEFLGVDGAQRHFVDAVGRLRQSSGPQVAGAAARAFDRLTGTTA